jgi:acyl-coenzyme A thioesterase PaaI-like protein
VTGNVDHVGRQTGVASAAVTDSAGRLFAQGTSTCLILAAE